MSAASVDMPTRLAATRTIALVPNLNDPDFDELREQPGFLARRARVSRQLGAERLGVSLWEVDPGEAAYPYHAHLTEEEIVVVLDGRPSLRTPEGWRQLEQGETLLFPTGEEGAHQIVNRTDSVVRFLAISTFGSPDVVLQPDSGKVGAFERFTDGSGMKLWWKREDAVGYYEGEQPPEPLSED
jgi:uncharacterized cupin superfamily protein